MNALTRFFTHPIFSRRFDASLPRWAGYVVGITMLALASATFLREATSQEELCLGLGVGVMSFLVSLLFGTLLGWLETSLLKKPMSHRRRIGEYLSYGSFPVILGLGMLGLSTLSLSKLGFLLGILLLMTVGLAAVCLGVVSSLMRIERV